MVKNVMPLHAAVEIEIGPAETAQEHPQLDAAPDPFDAKSLALPPDFHAAGGAANPKPKNVQVRKPHNQEWVRVHPGPDFHGNFGTILLKDDREFYLLTPAISKQMRGNRHLKTVTIYTAYSRLSGKTFLWPIDLTGQPGQNKRTENWYRTAHEAAEEAMRQLVNVYADMGGGGYEWVPSENPDAQTPPSWPEMTFNELLQVGFQRNGMFVDSFDHDVFKKLRAEF